MKLTKYQIGLNPINFHLIQKKTHFMYFKHHSHNTETPIYIKIDGMLLEKKTNSKFLGVLIDEALTWNDHLHQVTMCISKSIGIISKLKFLLPHATLFLLYNSLVLPYITYCNSVWANCGSTKINSIFNCKRKPYVFVQVRIS